MKAGNEAPPAPSTLAERLMLWRGRLPPPAPEILRGLAALKVSAISRADELAAMLVKRPTGGHWNSGIAGLRNNGLIEAAPATTAFGGKRRRAAALLRESVALSCNRRRGSLDSYGWSANLVSGRRQK